MIVKNESKIILNCLDSIVPFLDYWVICDTGSTDGTQTIIEDYFKKKQIEGELYNDEWVDFAHNRTLAFQRVKDKSQYCIVIDADDTFHGNLELPNDTNYTDFDIKIKLGNLEYYRKQIFLNSLDWKYTGVIHEYSELVSKNVMLTTKKLNNAYIQAGTFGNRNQQSSSKFKSDIQILLNGIEKEPNNARYYFYLANSYKDIQNYKEAIVYYKKRVDMGGWFEEIYYSLYCIGLCKEYSDSEYDFETEIIYDYLKAFNYRNTRLEALYRIISYFRKKKMYTESFAYAMLAKNTFSIPQKDVLFVDAPIQLYKFKDEFAISAYWVGFASFAHILNTDLLKNTNDISEEDRKRIIQNNMFCKKIL